MLAFSGAHVFRADLLFVPTEGLDPTAAVPNWSAISFSNAGWSTVRRTKLLKGALLSQRVNGRGATPKPNSNLLNLIFFGIQGRMEAGTANSSLFQGPSEKKPSFFEIQGRGRWMSQASGSRVEGDPRLVPNRPLRRVYSSL